MRRFAFFLCGCALVASATAAEVEIGGARKNAEADVKPSAAPAGDVQVFAPTTAVKRKTQIASNQTPVAAAELRLVAAVSAAKAKETVAAKDLAVAPAHVSSAKSTELPKPKPERTVNQPSSETPARAVAVAPATPVKGKTELATPQKGKTEPAVALATPPKGKTEPAGAPAAPPKGKTDLAVAPVVLPKGKTEVASNSKPAPVSSRAVPVTVPDIAKAKTEVPSNQKAAPVPTRALPAMPAGIAKNKTEIAANETLAPARAVSMTPAPAEKEFTFKDKTGKVIAAPIVDQFQKSRIVYPLAKIDPHISPMLARAASIAQERSHAHSKSACWRYVKTALLASGVISSYPKTAYAKQAGDELVRDYGFKKLPIRDPYKAPIGAVLVYGSRRAAGHVEIRTKTGFVSDFQNKKPSPRPLLGIYAKA